MMLRMGERKGGPVVFKACNMKAADSAGHGTD
jgi:hypothetical protein